MFQRIIEASDNYFNQIYNSKPIATENFESNNFFVSKIKAIGQNETKEIYFFADEDLIKDIYFFMLGEEDCSSQELKDFSCEIANLIVGSAKVLAQDDEDMFDISTPIFVSHANDLGSQNYDKSKNYKINNKYFSIKARYI